jgi:hypothetical protein
MEMTTCKELSNFYLPSVFDVIIAALDHVKQTYHFGDIGIQEKCITVDA